VLLSLTEYGAPTKGRWQASFLSSLRAESQKWKLILGLPQEPFSIEYVRQGIHSIRAQGIAGFLKIDDTAVEIRPKFLSPISHSWRRALWRILTLVEDEPSLESQSTAVVEDEESFSDLLGWILLDSVRLAKLQGVPRGYVEMRDVVPVLRGRIDLSRMVDIVSRPYILPCVYDNFSENIPLNRLVRWATGQLARLVNSPRLGKMLTDEADEFVGVDFIPPGVVEAERISLPVQYTHLDPALHVSRLLLRRQSLQHEEDEFRAPGFLWKSSEVFERFVGYLLERMLKDYQSLWRLESFRQTLAYRQGRNISTRPDYRIVSNNKTIAVLDAKYKVWQNNKRPMVQDVYQVMAAGRINNCSRVFLVYPRWDNTQPPVMTWRISGAGQPVTLAALFIDLSCMAQENGEQSLINAFRMYLRTMPP
jgi:5-methylcytosine-specific restriction enzyme subunit McrC